MYLSKIFSTVFLMALFLLGASCSNVCPSAKTESLKKLIADKKLITLTENQQDKLWKFTHHDYPIKCEVNLKESTFKIYSADWNPNFIVEEVLPKKSKFYGIF